MGFWSKLGSFFPKNIFSKEDEGFEKIKKEGESNNATGDGATRWKRRRLSEVASAGIKEFDYYNVDSGTQYDDALYKQLNGGAYMDTPFEVLQRIQRLSVLLYKKNARAFSSVEVVKDFVLGDGVTVEATNKDVQKIIDEHWLINEWEDKLEERVRTLSVAGELMFPILADDATGIIRLSSVSALQIYRVLRDPENGEDLRKVKAVLKDTSQDLNNQTVNLDDDAEAFNIFKPIHTKQVLDNVPDAPDLSNQKAGSRWCFFFAVNRLAGGTRGSPDLTATMDWIEGIDSFLFSVLERSELAMQVVFDLKFDGLREKQLKKEVEKFMGNLRAGEAYAHNEKVELKVQSPSIGSTEATEIYSVLSRMISSGTGLPGMFFGDADGISRSVASEMTIPATKRLQARQKFVRRIITKVIDLQIAYAKTHTSRLAGVPDDELFDYKIRMPKIMLKDLSQLTRAIAALAGALSDALEREVPLITPEVAQKVFINVLMDLDPDEDYLMALEELEKANPSVQEIMDKSMAELPPGETMPPSGTAVPGSPPAAAAPQGKMNPQVMQAYKTAKTAVGAVREARRLRRVIEEDTEDGSSEQSG